jgi:signal-transduction protein with cAMP-binding, CBS, and nucleotidyltransferase domain
MHVFYYRAFNNNYGDFVSKDTSENKTEEKSLIPIKAEDVMNTDVVILDENISVKKAAEIMSQVGVSAIIAIAEGKTKGILTERDILKRIVAEGKNSRKTKVKDIMSSPLITIGPSTDLEEVARLMFEKEIKNLPVSHENRLIGLVNLQDICRIQPEILRLLKQVMKPPKNLQKVLRYYII